MEKLAMNKSSQRVPKARNLLVQFRVWGKSRSVANHVGIDANSVQSLSLDRRRQARGEAVARTSSIAHLMVECSPIVGLTLTLRCMSGRVTKGKRRYAAWGRCRGCSYRLAPCHLLFGLRFWQPVCIMA